MQEKGKFQLKESHFQFQLIKRFTMNCLKSEIQKNFSVYIQRIQSDLSTFIDSIDIDDEFNFTYLDLFLLLKIPREKFYKFISNESHYFWYSEEICKKPTKGALSNLGLSENELTELKNKSETEFVSNFERWLLNINEEYHCFLDKFDFNLMSGDFEMKDIKGKGNKAIVLAYENKIFNVSGWKNFVINAFIDELIGFKVAYNRKNVFFFKKHKNYTFKIVLDPYDILDVNELLKSYGIFYFGLSFFVEDNDEGSVFYPPEISSILSEFLIKSYSVDFKNATYENSKIRIYANIKSYCKLLKVLLPSLESFVSEK